MESSLDKTVEKTIENEKPETKIDKFWGSLEDLVDTELDKWKQKPISMNETWDSLLEDRVFKENFKPGENDNKNDSGNDASDANENTYDGLSDDEKAKVKEAHPDWPDEIIDSICSWKEYEVLNNANLKVAHINDKPCLIRTDIDMGRKDEYGRTNAERMKKGLAPIGNDGESINLHHIGQRKDSPLAELTNSEHEKNYSVLHDKNKPTEVHGEGSTWNEERKAYWTNRPVSNTEG